MNVIFAIVILTSIILLLFSSPETVLSAMLSGGQKALDLTLKLTVIYAIWLGFSEIFVKCGLDKKTAKLLKPLNRFLFGKTDNQSEEFISMNLSANLLGISGATTPYGIMAIDSLSKTKNNFYAVSMFFVINATSVQLIPSSVLALRTSLNALSPSDIILPTILATAVSSIVGIILVKIFIRRD